MAAIIQASLALLNEPLASKQWITALDLAPIVNDIKNINSNNASEATLGANTFTGTQTAPAIVTDSVAEKTAGSGITVSNNLIRKTVATAVNATGTIAAAAVVKGLITSTSAAGVTATLDTAVAIAAAASAVQGTIIEFIVDNTAGASTVTVAVGAGIVAAKQVSTGDTANDVLLTVAASATVGIGIFRLVFLSATAATLFRIG